MSKDNLGDVPGIFAAAALTFDYMMTVVVSIGGRRVRDRSPFPWLHDHKVLLSIAFVALITLLNLEAPRSPGRCSDPDLRVHRRDPGD